VEQIRAWTREQGGRAGDLHVTLARPARTVEGSSRKEAAWSYSVLLRARSQDSFGVELAADTDVVAAIDGGLVADLNRECPGAVQIGDRILEADGAPCPQVRTRRELESWFSNRTRGSKTIVDLRLRLQRPLKNIDYVTVLPPVEYRPGAEPAQNAKAEPTSAESASTASTAELLPDAAGAALPAVKIVSKEVIVLAPANVKGPQPRRRWFNIFGSSCETQCCDTVDAAEESVVVPTSEVHLSSA
jgi:hypothetical protein